MWGGTKLVWRTRKTQTRSLESGIKLMKEILTLVYWLTLSMSQPIPAYSLVIRNQIIAVGDYSDCFAPFKPVPQGRAFRWTCRTDRAYFLGHNPGVFSI